MKRRVVQIAAVAFLLAVSLFTLSAMAGDNAPIITKEELKEMLDNPDVIVVDVRLENQWKETELKIKGAVWENPNEVDSWANTYSKDKTLVFYCA